MLEALEKIPPKYFHNFSLIEKRKFFRFRLKSLNKSLLLERCHEMYLTDRVIASYLSNRLHSNSQKCVPQQVSELANDHWDWQVWMLIWKWMCESVREAWTEGRRLLQHWGCKGKGRVRGLQSYKYGSSRRFPCLYTECMELLQFPTTASPKGLAKVGKKSSVKLLNLWAVYRCTAITISKALSL